MYVYTDGHDDEDDEDYDSTAYWCLKTMKNFGPDDEMVGRPECRRPVADLLRTDLITAKSE